MNPFRLTTTLVLALLFIGNASAQDDFYPSSSKKKSKKSITQDAIDHVKEHEATISESEYSTATDYYIKSIKEQEEAAYNERMGITDSTTYYEDENGNVRITNNYYHGDNYDFDNEYHDY